MNKILIAVLLAGSLFFTGCQQKAASIGIIGGADGPTKIYLNSTEEKNESTSEVNIFEGYTLIEVDGGNLSGYREPNVAVDIGFGEREYWAFTNEYGQLVKVIANKIILQDDNVEPVLSTGRYYPDEAKVPGVESKTLDEGHVIADSLGGVSNAYNITPQESTLNRHGDQAYMEKSIRDAGGCTDFTAIITYPDTVTQIPSHYSITYNLKGNVIHEEFDNVNPDEVNNSNLIVEPGPIKTIDANIIEITGLNKNAEYIEITNFSDTNADLSGWKIVSIRGEQTFIFPAGFILQSGNSVKVGGYSAKDQCDLIWEDGNGVWNNSKSDPAELYDAAGNLISKIAD